MITSKSLYVQSYCEIHAAVVVLEIVQVPNGVPGDEGQCVGGRHDHQYKYRDHHLVLPNELVFK